jgi:fatty acid desaturase
MLLTAHIGGYLAVVVLVLSPGQALAFVAVHQGLLGLYLGSSFAPNHKGMPLLRSGQRPDFLRRQVLTSRNIRGGRLLTLAMGGLNYQIEHHLFPSMPSPTLRRAAPLIRAFCAAHQLPYHEASWLGSYTQVLDYLHRVGAPAGPQTSRNPS